MNEYGLQEGDRIEVHRITDGIQFYGNVVGGGERFTMRVLSTDETHAVLTLTDEEYREVDEEDLDDFALLCVPRDKPDKHPRVAEVREVKA